jgi:uncharacterized protein DUF3291
VARDRVSAVSFHLAQLNIARLRAPLDSPIVAGFVAALDPINALADAAPGFVWRLQSEGGDATAIRAFDDDLLLVNLTVWESIEALADFAYRSDHRRVLLRRREWFDRLGEVYLVLWWIPAGAIPTIEEAKDRLDLLRRVGPSLDAFTFKSPFPPPGSGRVVEPSDRWAQIGRGSGS